MAWVCTVNSPGANDTRTADVTIIGQLSLQPMRLNYVQKPHDCRTHDKSQTTLPLDLMHGKSLSGTT
ncbi:MAG: hypothetical protein WCH60_18970, partial [Burkholderiales bacterium]